MPDEESGKKTGSVVAGGAGVLAGAGISTTLFSTIGIANIMASPGGHSTVYPLVVFSLAALFLLTAAMFTLRISPEQRTFVAVGGGFFILMALMGSYIVFKEEYDKPTITFTEIFDPQEITSAGATPAKFSLVFATAHAGVNEGAPFKNPVSVSKDDVIALKLNGLQELESNYAHEFLMLKDVCASGAAAAKSEVCTQIGQLPEPTVW